MNNSLLINQYVKKILESSDGVCKYVQDRIFPLDALQGTSFPFIVLTRQSMTDLDSKDNIYQTDVPVQITVVADKYSTSVTLANEIRKSLVGVQYCTDLESNPDEDPINIVDCKMTGCYESIFSNAYIQQLDFEFTVQ